MFLCACWDVSVCMLACVVSVHVGMYLCACLHVSMRVGMCLCSHLRAPELLICALEAEVDVENHDHTSTH